MTKCYKIGPDAVDNYSLPPQDGLQWLVYWYENFGYEGEGQAVALWDDDTLTVKDLTHCSCYGPFDNWNKDNLTIAYILKEKDDVHDVNIREDIMTKIRELMCLA